jgi:hypothetical protein
LRIECDHILDLCEPELRRRRTRTAPAAEVPLAMAAPTPDPLAWLTQSEPADLGVGSMSFESILPTLSEAPLAWPNAGELEWWLAPSAVGEGGSPPTS